jgi:hypothetical protein
MMIGILLFKGRLKTFEYDLSVGSLFSDGL